MGTLYFIALAFIFIGGITWFFSRKVTWQELAGGSAAALLLAMIFHLVGANMIVSDTQTYSGQIIQANRYAAWREYYEEAVYRTEYYNERVSYTETVGSGAKARTVTKHRTERRSRRVFDHWEGHKRWHNESYDMSSNINTRYDIDRTAYWDTCKKFGGEVSVKGDRRTGEHNSRMIDGDPNDYMSTPKTGYVYPVTKPVSFENKLKAGPSVFSFVEVPKTIPVFEWPANSNPFQSERLLGQAQKDVSISEWDKLNARLGPTKKANLILIGFGAQDSSIAQYQRAKFLGGKRNDVVMCYGGSAAKPNWTVVFGWTDSELVKQNLQTLLLEKGVSNAIIPDIEKEITAHYQVKNWHAFDHLTVPPSNGLITWYIITLILTQSVLYIFFYRNEFEASEEYAGQALKNQ